MKTAYRVLVSAISILIIFAANLPLLSQSWTQLAPGGALPPGSLLDTLVRLSANTGEQTK